MTTAPSAPTATTHRDPTMPPGSTVDLPTASRPRPATLWSAPLVLPPDTLACRSCGIAIPVPVVTDEDGAVGVVDGDGVGERLLLDVTETATRVGHPGPDGHPRPLARVAFTVCEGCHERSQAQRNGWRLTRLIYARHAVAALGVTPPRSMSWEVLVRHVADPDVDVDLSWSARFAPVMAVGADPGTCNLRPWSHLTDKDRTTLRTAYAAALAEHMAGFRADVALTPPGEVPGCLFCGVASVTVPAAEAARLGGAQAAAAHVWQACSVDLGSLGGRSTAERLAGHLCTPCSTALSDVGVMGQTTTERAFLRYVRSTDRADDVLGWREEEISGLAAWAVLRQRAERDGRPGPGPNAEPWAHIRTRP